MAQQAPVNQGILDKLLKAKKKGDEVVILTARSAHYRSDTVRWLTENGVPYDSLVMRPTDDTRKDKVVKRDLLENHVLPHYAPTKAYDDKAKNRKMFEKHGIKAKGVE